MLSSIRAWVIIAPLECAVELPRVNGDLIVSHQCMPGYEIATSDGGGKPIESRDYFVEHQEDRLVITSLTKEAFPLIRLLVP
ncbi:MAG: hypothetical protein RIQ56_832, partial [Candidatus Parcubacteria bacterium]